MVVILSNFIFSWQMKLLYLWYITWYFDICIPCGMSCLRQLTYVLLHIISFLFWSSKKVFIDCISNSCGCNTPLLAVVTMICHRPLEGTSSSKLKAGWLSRVTSQPLGAMFLPSASMGSDSTCKWSRSAQPFWIPPTTCDIIFSSSTCVVIGQVAFYLVCTNNLTVSYIKTWTFSEQLDITEKRAPWCNRLKI